MGEWRFLSPLFLLGALSVAVPIVLHLFRRRNDPVVPFSMLRFLQAAPIEQARRRRLQDLLLLALRAAALLLLALGFARPFLQTPADASGVGVRVIAIDTSASMGDAARFARARSLAEAAIAATPADELVAIMRFAGAAEVLMEPGLDRGAARTTLSQVQPGAGPTRYHAAVARAFDAIGTRRGRIVLITDLQSSGWGAADAMALPERVALEVHDVGPLPPNAGITALDRVPDGIRVGVSSTGAARSVDVALLRDGVEVGRRRVALPADGAADLVFRDVAATGIIQARLTAADGLPADDERWLVLDARPRQLAVVVTSPGAGAADAVYVRRALEVAEAPHEWQVALRPADRVRDVSDLAGAALVVIVGTAGLDRRGAEALGRFAEHGGGVLLPIGPGINVELLTTGLGERLPRVRVGPVVDVPLTLVPTDRRHPVFRLFPPDAGAFDGARFNRVAMVAATGPAQVLARFDSGSAALVDQRVGRGRIAVLGSDLSNRWNDLVLQPTFVPWLVETASWLAGGRTAPDALVAGDGPSAEVERPGVAAWRPAGAGASVPAVRVAVNVASEEFDPRRLDEATFASQVPRDADDHAGQPAAARRQENEQGWWRYGLALMLVGLIAESVIGRRG
jgi:hypothetical protein